MADTTSIGIINIKTTSIRELSDVMMREEIAHCMIAVGEHITIHVALMFDTEGAIDLQRVLSDITARSIATANTRYKRESGQH